MKKMNKINNKGFSLVELIIAITLLVVVAITSGMLISSGSDLFSSVNARENLQYKSQISLGQIKAYLSSSDAIYIDGDSTQVSTPDSSGIGCYYTKYTNINSIYTVVKDRIVTSYNSDGTINTYSDTYYRYEIKYDADEQTISMARAKYVLDGNGSKPEDENDPDKFALLVSSVVDIKADVQHDLTEASNIKILLTFAEKGRKNYTKAYVVDFRGTPTICGNIEIINNKCANKNEALVIN